MTSSQQLTEEEYALLKRRMSQLGLLALELSWRQWWELIQQVYPDGMLPPKLPTWDRARLKEMHHLINHPDSQYKGELHK